MELQRAPRGRREPRELRPVGLATAATHRRGRVTLNARADDVVKELRQITRIGPDYAFDSVGAKATIVQALTAVRPGGTAVVMGMHALKEEVPIPAGALIAQNKRLLGSFAGSSKPLVDLPKLIDLFRGGRLPVDKLISHRYRLDQVNEAFADLEAGKVARGVLVME